MRSTILHPKITHTALAVPKRLKGAPGDSWRTAITMRQTDAAMPARRELRSERVKARQVPAGVTLSEEERVVAATIGTVGGAGGCAHEGM